MTNSYTLVSDVVMRNDLNHVFDAPIECSVDNGNNMLARMVAGNNNGLLVPGTTSEEEMSVLMYQLPASVRVAKVNDTLTALGNCIACNDSVALIHPDFSDETEQLI